MKVGDFVRRKAGGPTMVIVHVEGPSSTVERQEKIVDCLWLEGKKFKRDLFGAGELELDTVEETCAS